MSLFFVCLCALHLGYDCLCLFSALRFNAAGVVSIRVLSCLCAISHYVVVGESLGC